MHISISAVHAYKNMISISQFKTLNNKVLAINDWLRVLTCYQKLKSHCNLHQAMDITQLENHKLELECIEAFKQGDHDEALRLFSCLQQPAAVQTSHVFYPLMSNLTCTNVSLLHLAALYGWMYIVVSLVWEYNCSSQCCDDSGQTPLHYAAHGGSLPVVQYLITEQHCDPLQCNN